MGLSREQLLDMGPEDVYKIACMKDLEGRKEMSLREIVDELAEDSSDKDLGVQYGGEIEVAVSEAEIRREFEKRQDEMGWASFQENRHEAAERAARRKVNRWAQIGFDLGIQTFDWESEGVREVEQ